MKWSTNRRLTVRPSAAVSDLPLTVSYALSELPTAPGSPHQLLYEFALRSSRPLEVLSGSPRPLGDLDRSGARDTVTLPIGTKIRQSEAGLHQLGHLMIGHDACYFGQSELRGDERLQELDAELFAGQISDRHRQVKRATGRRYPSDRRLKAAYVLGTITDDWPKRMA